MEECNISVRFSRKTLKKGGSTFVTIGNDIPSQLYLSPDWPTWEALVIETLPLNNFRFINQAAAHLIDVKFVFTHRIPLLCKKWNLVVFPQNKETTLPIWYPSQLELTIGKISPSFAKVCDINSDRFPRKFTKVHDN